MMVDELLRKAKEVGKWRVTAIGHIRCAKGDCPIVAVANHMNLDRQYGNHDWDLAAEYLQIDRKVANLIVSSADNEFLGRSTAMRETMVKFLEVAYDPR